MSALNKHFLTALLCAAAFAAFAQDDEPRRNPLLNAPLALNFVAQDSGRPGGTAIHYLFLTTPFARITPMSVQAPVGYTPAFDARTGTLRFSRADQTGWLTLRLINTGSGAAILDNEITQQWLVRQHPGAKLLKAAPGKLGDFSGFSYDLQWPTSGGLFQRQRALYAPLNGGILEFTLNSTPDVFPKLEPDFSSLAFTFRLCPRGKADLAPPPSDSN
jgi:hypothetical protein